MVSVCFGNLFVDYCYFYLSPPHAHNVTPKRAHTDALIHPRSWHSHCSHAHIHILPIPIPVYSPQSWDELKRAVNDCFGVSLEENPKPAMLHGPIGQWDVSQVTDMNTIFFDLDTFNAKLSHWDVSRVTDMSGMFAHALNFNQDLSKWDVSRVTSMVMMFRHTSFFNQDLSNWDVSRVTNMGTMFLHAKSFNQDLSYWDVSRVTNMLGMFANAHSFNQTLCGAAWVNSDALKVDMFTDSPGSISTTVCGE